MEFDCAEQKGKQCTYSFNAICSNVTTPMRGVEAYWVMRKYETHLMPCRDKAYSHVISKLGRKQ